MSDDKEEQSLDYPGQDPRFKYNKSPNPSACPKCGGEFQIYDWGVDGSTAWCYCQCTDEKCMFGWNEDFRAMGWYESK